MKNNSQSTAYNVTSYKFSSKVEGILGVTFGSFGTVKKSKCSTLGQQTLKVLSVSTPVFWFCDSKKFNFLQKFVRRGKQWC